MYLHHRDHIDDRRLQQQQQPPRYKSHGNDRCQTTTKTTPTSTTSAANKSNHSNFDDDSDLDVYQQNQIIRHASLSNDDVNNNDDNGKKKLNLLEKLCHHFNAVRDGCRIHLSIGIDIIRLAIRQPVTVFILLLIIDFIFNTLMLYYDYVYIMVDVDFGVQNMDTMYVWHEHHHNHHDNNNNNNNEQPPPSINNNNNDDVKIESNSTSIRNRRSITTPTGSGDNSRNNANKNKGFDSISFVEDSDNRIYSYQYGVNLAMYIIIYASQVNGFFAYIWLHHSWLTLHLTIVAIQIVFLLFLSIVNVRLIIVLVFRMMLFFMSLFRSLEISNYQMICLQRQGLEIQSELPRVKIFTPNGHRNCNKKQQSDLVGTNREYVDKNKYDHHHHQQSSNCIHIGNNSENKLGHHKAAVTVSDQDGQQVGYVTLSVEMERSSESIRSSSTTSALNQIGHVRPIDFNSKSTVDVMQPKLFPIKRSYQHQKPSIFL
ncbi:uncharacterized protein LOC124490112 [Dermatophagoides farinae]|uniref:uncharacterized protein LOC124490112 n=1 Tax=Dermatophagoides farinae TaxID=6954 RepID=UPI003F62613C